MTDAPPYAARVLRSRRVSPHVVRVTLHDLRARGDLPAPASSGRADEFFGLWLPVADADGEPVKRYYTVRAWRRDPEELDVDFLLHGPGAASSWADAARPGEGVEFDAPRGHYAPPADSRWIGLCGDATALPAIGRILDERAGGADGSDGPPVRVVIALDDPTDRCDLPLAGTDEVTWVAPRALVPATLALTNTAAPGYLWFAGEAADLRAVRHRVRRELRWPVERWSTMAYWRRDSDAWVARLRADGALVAQLEAIYADDGDAEAQQDRAEELLARNGLL